MKLYSYWRSSASYRVRIFLNLKGLDWQQEAIHLVKDGGQQFSENFLKLNPSALVPAFEDEDLVLNQSLAIMEYLEEKYPEPALLPNNLGDKALCRALCYDIACDAAPLNNLRVRQYLGKALSVTSEDEQTYLHHWLAISFDALETRLNNRGSDFQGRYLWGDSATMADAVLIPQIYNALRLKYNMREHPKLYGIWQHCNTLDAFVQAQPENQADAV